MVTGLIIAIVVLAAGLYMASMNKPNNQQQDMSPNTLEAFKATTNDEGTVVPLVIGIARISANLLWYGNLVTVEVVEQVETGGKGGGGGGTQDVTVGYQYYMDIWESLCIGPDVSVIGMFANDKSSGFTGTLNPGDTSYFPTEPGQYAAPLNPIAHVFFKRRYIGENVSAIPTYHFVVKKDSTAPITHANMTYGVNPAAAIYDLLVMAGALSSDFVLSTFQDAADYWYDKGYAINIVTNKQEEVRNIINRIFTYVDGNIRLDNQDRFELVAWKDTDTHQYTIDQNSMKDFNFRRRSWEDVHNDFRANFMDSAQSYTQRTVRVRNTAVRKLTGRTKQITLDLTAYINLATVSARLWEVMKRLSYPEAQCSCKVSMEYHYVRVGDVVRVSHSDYGIVDADFRITGVDISKADSNEITWTMVQLLSTLFDASFINSGGSSWTEPSYDPVAPYDNAVFELPYNDVTGQDAAYLLLIARKGAETGFKAMVSGSGTDYLNKGNFTSFSQVGTLDETYPATTYAIDDEVGILYTPSREDPAFLDISRTELFNTTRICIIGTEIMTFQTVTYEGGSSIRLGGVIRGLLNTAVVQHTSGSKIWITNFHKNVLTNVVNSSFYVKMLPYFGATTLDASAVSPISVTYSQKAITPWGINTALATRSGSDITVEVQNTTQEIRGAGTRPSASMPQSVLNGDALPVEGFIEWWTSYDTTVNQETINSFSISHAGSFTLYLRQNLNGKYSDTVTFSVGSTDGDYYLDDNQLTNTGLEKIKWGTQGWITVMNRNAERLNDTLLKVSGLLDVNDAGIKNAEALIWDAGTQKFIPAAFNVAFPTTTSSTTTTTSTSTTTNTESTTSSSSTTTNTESTTSTSSTTTNTASTTTTSSSSTTTTEPPVYEGLDVAVDSFIIDAPLIV